MKLVKLAWVILLLVMTMMMAACGKKCYNCGEPLNGEGYTVFGNTYCEDCFKYDMGI